MAATAAWRREVLTRDISVPRACRAAKPKPPAGKHRVLKLKVAYRYFGCRPPAGKSRIPKSKAALNPAVRGLDAIDRRPASVKYASVRATGRLTRPRHFKHRVHDPLEVSVVGVAGVAALTFTLYFAPERHLKQTTMTRRIIVRRAGFSDHQGRRLFSASSILAKKLGANELQQYTSIPEHRSSSRERAGLQTSFTRRIDVRRATSLRETGPKARSKHRLHIYRRPPSGIFGEIANRPSNFRNSILRRRPSASSAQLKVNSIHKQTRGPCTIPKTIKLSKKGDAVRLGDACLSVSRPCKVSGNFLFGSKQFYSVVIQRAGEDEEAAPDPPVQRQRGGVGAGILVQHQSEDGVQEDVQEEEPRDPAMHEDIRRVRPVREPQKHVVAARKEEEHGHIAERQHACAPHEVRHELLIATGVPLHLLVRVERFVPDGEEDDVQRDEDEDVAALPDGRDVSQEEGEGAVVVGPDEAGVEVRPDSRYPTSHEGQIPQPRQDEGQTKRGQAD
ncbi:hypothetical protein R3P38DRAFT_3348548 [Favolaschia claudopus]|uniref:Uncharacterized protein n=1 Tax=Favolaschia claudopus TaxID=2862362 RepID=A0AAW0CVA5_9AGAR